MNTKTALTLALFLLSGQEALAWGGCPPQRWDFPYRGKLSVHYLDGPQLAARCGSVPFGMLTACAYMARGSCLVYISRNSPNPACSLKHEIAHCNGWPRNHPP